MGLINFPCHDSEISPELNVITLAGDLQTGVQRNHKVNPEVLTVSGVFRREDREHRV